MKRNLPHLTLVSVLLAANVLLSYARLSTLGAGWILALGVLLPWVLLLLGTGGPKDKNLRVGVPGTKETLKVHFWVWGLLLLGLVPRVLRITEVFLWPTGDEGLHGFLA